MASTADRIKTVTTHSSDYTQRWCVTTAASTGSMGVAVAELRAALLLLASGSGPARLPTCNAALRSVRLNLDGGGPNDAAARAVLHRALLLFGPGELQELRAVDVATIDFMRSMLHGSAGDAVVLRGALQSLRTVVWSNVTGNVAPGLFLVKLYASSLTQLDVLVVSQRDLGDAVLSHCTRLESLTHAYGYTPAVWLGLSQLHTLRGVDLRRVTFAAMASALPQLHTLEAFYSPSMMIARHGDDDEDYFTFPTQAAVGALCEDLLPRLRAFHFRGLFLAREDASDPAAPPPRPLPLLRELVWLSGDVVPRAFMGAQPHRLHAPHRMVAEWMTPVGAQSSPVGERLASSPLAQVRELLIHASTSADATPLNSAALAALLCAAPQLRRLTVPVAMKQGHHHPLPWLAPNGTAPDTAFAGLVHAALRYLSMNLTRRSDLNDRAAAAAAAPVAPLMAQEAICGVRKSHFPRLQELAFDQVRYFATPLELQEGREGGSSTSLLGRPRQKNFECTIM